MPLAYGGQGFKATVEQLVRYEDAGLDIVFLPEAYTFDSVSQLGYIAGKTTTLGLGAGILNIFSRTPTLLAMTAAGLDHISDGRFSLGIGASGPQVVEGFHGVRYDSPLARSREVASICRSVWKREKLEHDGDHYSIPLSATRGGSGLGKPLKLINTPFRPSIPIVLAALGPKNVALAAELFEGWEPLFFYPEGADAAFGNSLADGVSRRDPALGSLDIFADTRLRITTSPEEEDAALQRVREHLALYIGGMGAKGKNFYNELACRYGFPGEAEKVQTLFLGGDKAEAAAALPEELVRGVSLIGSVDEVRARVAAFAAAGVTTLNAQSTATDDQSRLEDIATLVEIVRSHQPI